MKSDLIAAYANLTAKNTYESSLPDDARELIITINNQKFIFERIHDSIKDNETGYQGHIYKNTSNGDIIVVHEGSIPLNQTLKKPNEVKKDWFNANMDTLMGIVNKQFKPAEEFVDLAKKIAKLESPTGKVIIIGQSLGGTLSELTGALAKNKDIETYTFNSFGAGYLLDDLNAMNKDVSNDYSNIRNLTYSNEYPTKINPHIGNVFKSDYIAPKSSKSPSFHSVEAHHENGALDYELDPNYPTILKNENLTEAINHAIFKPNPIVTQVSNSELVKRKKEQLENTLQNANAIKLEVSMDNYLYIVKNGETIWDIIKRTGIPYEKLLEVNPWLAERYSSDTDSVIVYPGDKIFVPINWINNMETPESNDGLSNVENTDFVEEDSNNSTQNYEDSSESTDEMSNNIPGLRSVEDVEEFKKSLNLGNGTLQDAILRGETIVYDAYNYQKELEKLSEKDKQIFELEKSIKEMKEQMEKMQVQLDFHEKVVNIYNYPDYLDFYLDKPVRNIIASVLQDYCIMEGIDYEDD